MERAIAIASNSQHNAHVMGVGLSHIAQINRATR